jgi:hypothetical protein
MLRLWCALHERFGTAPRFELRPARYAYHLFFDRTAPDVNVFEIRAVIEEIVPFGVGIILAKREALDGPEAGKPRTLVDKPPTRG